MAVEITYLTVGDVIAIHEHVMARLGHMPEALRDEGGLESAIMRPRQAAYYENKSNLIPHKRPSWR